MYIVVIYDISSGCIGNVLKTCRKYLHWVQNSVFEGEITERNLARLQQEITAMIDKTKDSVIFYRSRQESWMKRSVIGIEKNEISNIV